MVRSKVFAAAGSLIALFAMLPSTASASIPAYRDGDQSVTARNILSLGQGRHLNAAEFAQLAATGEQPDYMDDQLAMYEDLVRRAPGLNGADLPMLFKDASFGVAPGDAGRTYQPRSDVTVVRDLSFNVPHVFGQTRAGTMFGAGYVTGEDRLFMMDVLRHVARGRLSEFLGASNANLASDRATYAVADYTEAELQAMGDRLKLLNPTLGQQAFDDTVAFAAGVNKFIEDALLNPALLPVEYAALQQVPLPWKQTDSIALATLIGGTFSVGGGGQLENARFLAGLEQLYSPATARAIFDDMKNANDIEAPTATETAFPNNDNPVVNPASVARPDNPTAVAAQVQSLRMPPSVDGPFGPIQLLQPKPASNAVLVDAARSTTGNPLALFGPQVGYYSPQILMEIDLQGPGVQARGAAFPGISMYVLLGRGAGYGWSATTAIGDHTDIRAVPLCEIQDGESTISGYERDGECRPIHRRTDTWLAKPSAGGIPGEPINGDEIVVTQTTERVQLGDPEGRPAGLGDAKIGPDWAIIIAKGKVGGRPVAFARQRSSYGIEVDATLSFAALHDPANIGNLNDLARAFGDWFSFSFNWHLVDGDDMGFYTTGRYPVLADGVDPELPFWGDSQWDWKRFLTYAEHPQSKNESKGWIANWNNKQAPGFRASDDWFSYGSVGRVELLEAGIEAALAGDDKISPVELTKLMGIAATQDLRAFSSLEHVLAILGPQTGNPARAAAVSMLSDWLAGGAHRRDLDGDRSYDEAKPVAIMDALWNPLLDAVFQPSLGPALNLLPDVRDDAAGPGGSAYLEGWYGQLEKDLRTTRGLSVAQPYSRQYCGGGSLSACRAALESALDAALSSVNLDDPNLGKALWEKDGIKFSPVGVVSQRQMHWQNRPTFQQLLEFN